MNYINNIHNNNQNSLKYIIHKDPFLNNKKNTNYSDAFDDISKLQWENELLKKQLHAEGLFDQRHKKPLPTLPKTIGVITSPTGAAIRDILSVLKRRFPAIPVIIYPAQVQGNKAADDIVKAIELANHHQECDVLLLSRGGGSLEDLWPFNEERVARAIFASDLPIVSGVGHEVDITISDYVADVRAATPSAAAELVVPDIQHYLIQFQRLETHLGSAILRFLGHWQLKLDHLQQRLQHPGAKLQRQMQHVDQLASLLEGYFRQQLHRKHTQYLLLQQRLQQSAPSHQLPLLNNRIQQLEQQLHQHIKNYLVNAKNRFSQLTHTLEAVSPLATLNRGYAIVTTETNQVLSTVSQAKTGDSIKTRVSDGVIHAKISHIDLITSK